MYVYDIFVEVQNESDFTVSALMIYASMLEIKINLSEKFNVLMTQKILRDANNYLYRI